MQQKLLILGRVLDKDALDRARKKPCIVCGKKAEAAHIKSRGAGGDDADWNLLSLCRIHHSAQHTMGWHHFAVQWPIVQRHLFDKGWEFIGLKLTRALPIDSPSPAHAPEPESR